MSFSLSALLLSLGSMLSFGVCQYFSAPVSRALGPWKALFLFQLLGIPLLLLLVPIARISLDTRGLPLISGLAILCIANMLLYFHALRVGQVSVVVPVSEAYVFVTVALSVILFNEEFNFHRQLGLATLVFGLVLISTDFSQFKKN